MRFRTVGSLFIIFTLWVCMVYFSHKFTVWFWAMTALTLFAKAYLLSAYIRLNNAQNRAGVEVMDLNDDPVICRYDVTRQLIEAPDTRADDVINPIRPYVNLLGSYTDYTDNATQFSIPQRHILAVETYLTELYGDGHYEFFTGPYGMAYLDAIEGLKAIGAEEQAEILRNAAAEFDGIAHPLIDLGRRIDAIESLDLDFEEADEAAFSDESYELIERLAMEYIRAHADDFLFDNPHKQ